MIEGGTTLGFQLRVVPPRCCTFMWACSLFLGCSSFAGFVLFILVVVGEEGGGTVVVWGGGGVVLDGKRPK